MPPTHRSYWVYVLTNQPYGTLYVGVTSSLKTRIWQHQSGTVDGFTKRYELKRLVYLEEFRDVSNAIARETELKGWRRARKLALIELDNRMWEDLSKGWYD